MIHPHVVSRCSPLFFFFFYKAELVLVSIVHVPNMSWLFIYIFNNYSFYAVCRNTYWLPLGMDLSCMTLCQV